MNSFLRLLNNDGAQKELLVRLWELKIHFFLSLVSCVDGNTFDLFLLSTAVVAVRDSCLYGSFEATGRWNGPVSC